MSRQIFCHSYRSRTYILIAEDKPSVEALNGQPDLPTKKKQWLHQHDRESGDLYYMLQLIPGMLVATADHID